jgi:hypothetical protein
MTTRFAFVDTNIFLHYPSLEDLFWPDLLGVGQVIIVVTATVIRELNRHKDAPVSSKLRDRAASVLRRLFDYSEADEPVLIRDGVELRFHTREPLLNFVSEGLVREIPDDYLVATIIEFSRAHPQHDAVLVTDDMGLKLKARTFGISTFRPPEDLRLPDELDPSQKRIRELEERVRLLQFQFPDMRLVFGSGEDRLHLALKPQVALSPKVLTWRLSRLRTKFPKMQKPVSLSGLYLQMGAIPPAAYDDYNDRIQGYFSNYAAYLAELQDHLNQGRRTAELKIWALNKGTAPGKDVHVFIHFPDGFEVFRKSELPKRPGPPRPPDKPKSVVETLTAGTVLPNVADLLATGTSLHNISLPQLSANVRLLSIRRTTSYEVELHIGEVKHNFMVPLDPIYIGFDPSLQARSFSGDYRIYCGNAPEKQSGQLHVIVENKRAKTCGDSKTIMGT